MWILQDKVINYQWPFTISFPCLHSSIISKVVQSNEDSELNLNLLYFDHAHLYEAKLFFCPSAHCFIPILLSNLLSNAESLL